MSTENKETTQIDALLQASCVEGYEVDRFENKFFDRKVLALSIYGEGWFEALNECDGVHVAGDCPLCGAV